MLRCVVVALRVGGCSPMHANHLSRGWTGTTTECAPPPKFSTVIVCGLPSHIRLFKHLGPSVVISCEMVTIPVLFTHRVDDFMAEAATSLYVKSILWSWPGTIFDHTAKLNWEAFSRATTDDEIICRSSATARHQDASLSRARHETHLASFCPIGHAVRVYSNARR